MKNSILIFAAAMCIGLPASTVWAISGLGIGVKLGQVTDYDNPQVKIADLKFDDFRLYGAHARLKRGSVAFELGLERFKDKEQITLFGESVEAKASDWITHATLKLYFPFPLVQPFVGGGVARHRFTYDYSGPLGQYEDVTISVPRDQAFFGYHIVAGAELGTKMLPFNLFVEGKYQKVNSNPDTDFTTISGGLIFNLP